jgi:hypothetical protein
MNVLLELRSGWPYLIEHYTLSTRPFLLISVWNSQLESLTVEDESNTFFRNVGNTNPATRRHISSDINLLWHSCGDLKFIIFLLKIREMSLTLPEHTHRPKDIMAHYDCLTVTTWAAKYKQWKQNKWEIMDGSICCPHRPFNFWIPTRLKNFAEPDLRNIY